MSGIMSLMKQSDMGNVRLRDAGQPGPATSGGHDEKGGHHSHLDSKGYSEGVEGDYI